MSAIAVYETNDDHASDIALKIKLTLALQDDRNDEAVDAQDTCHNDWNQ